MIATEWARLYRVRSIEFLGRVELYIFRLHAAGRFAPGVVVSTN